MGYFSKGEWITLILIIIFSAAMVCGITLNEGKKFL